MAIESLVEFIKSRKHPIEVLPFGFISASIAILLAIWIFPGYSSFAMITFTVMATLPLMIQIMHFEKEQQIKKKKIIIHKKAISFFIFLFLGFILAYTFWFLLLPTNIANNLFSMQIESLTNINITTSAAITFNPTFFQVLKNNLTVLSLSFFLSLIFASGAIFVIVWNASIIGVAMASAIKIAIAASGPSSSNYFGAFLYSLLRYLPHGIPEITSYFIAGLAAGILSFTLLDYKSKKAITNLKKVFPEALFLIVVGFTLTIISAIIEVYITPLLLG